MTSTSVQVAVRVRPLAPKELLAHAGSCIRIIPNENILVLSGRGAEREDKSFVFDFVYGTDSSQLQIYEGCVKPLLDGFLEGFNATILAYGQVNIFISNF